MPADCPLCAEAGGEIVWRDDRLRVILPDEPDYPGFTRIVWTAHLAEMTDLPRADADHLFATVLAVEAAMRRALAPDKINLASLGNQVPHLHWHVIARWRDDAHFPAPIWSSASPQRAAAAADRRADVAARVPAYRDALRAALDRRAPG
jgi:diadenosine tetraphosphate (Ap4A) HIT family hydrolase